MAVAATAFTTVAATVFTTVSMTVAVDTTMPVRLRQMIFLYFSLFFRVVLKECKYKLMKKLTYKNVLLSVTFRGHGNVNT